MAISAKDKKRIASVFEGKCSEKNICPIKDIIATYGDKWSMYIILSLGQCNSMRFNELKTSIDGISQRMLTVTLRSLERDGLVLRTVYAQPAVRIEYELTELGESLLKQLLALTSWAEENFAVILRSRKNHIKQKT